MYIYIYTYIYAHQFTRHFPWNTYLTIFQSFFLDEKTTQQWKTTTKPQTKSPSPSIYQGMDQALHWLSELVTNSSLRLQLRQQALQLAEPYSLEKLSQRLALIFAQVLKMVKHIERAMIFVA